MNLVYNYILLFIQATGPETTASLLAAGLDARAAELVSQLFFILMKSIGLIVSVQCAFPVLGGKEKRAFQHKFPFVINKKKYVYFRDSSWPFDTLVELTGLEGISG